MPQKVVIGDNASKFILIGEDDPDDQEILKEIFASVDESFILFFVNNGKELFSALDKLKKDQMPCLIVLDYNMPGSNGAEILGELNKYSQYHDIPKMIWSTSGSEKFRNICMQLGAVDYITKPTSVSDLENAVRYMLSVCTV